MLVIADSSPLHSLVEIGHAHILPILFTRVLIPPQVEAELSHPRTPPTVKEFVAHPPTWLETREPSRVEEISGLDLGERAAISLACEVQPDFLLIDERSGRQEAISRGLVVIGTVGVLERAADQGLIELRAAFDGLRRTRFHVAESLLEDALRRHEPRRRGQRGTE